MKDKPPVFLSEENSNKMAEISLRAFKEVYNDLTLKGEMAQQAMFIGKVAHDLELSGIITGDQAKFVTSKDALSQTQGPRQDIKDIFKALKETKSSKEALGFFAKLYDSICELFGVGKMNEAALNQGKGFTLKRLEKDVADNFFKDIQSQAK